MSETFTLPNHISTELERHLAQGSVEPFFQFVCMVQRSAEMSSDPGSWQNILAGFADLRSPVGDTLLSVWATLTKDEVEAQRIYRDVSLHNQDLPQWVHRLREAQVTETSVVGHPLDLGVQVLFGMKIADRDLTLIAFLDRGGISFLEDVDLLDGSPSTIMLEALAHEPASTDIPLSLADARATLEEGLRFGSQMHPPINTSTWPSLAPVVEWVAHLLPEGGTPLPRNEWSYEDTDRLVEEFLAEQHASLNLSASGLLQVTTHLVLNYGGGNPLHWSPAFIGQLLQDLLLRKVLAGPEDYDGYEELLMAFIRFAHDKAGLSSHHTDEVLEVVKEEFPIFISALQDDSNYDEDDANVFSMDHLSLGHTSTQARIAEAMLEHITFEVGGREHLETLDVQPLDASEDLHRIPLTADVEKAFSIANLASTSAEELFGDAELATVMINLLTDVTIMAPRVIRRAQPATVAAAIAWIAAENNGHTGHGRVTQKDISTFFEVSSVFRERADLILEGILPYTREPDEAWFPLGETRFLTSRSRQRILEMKQHYEAVLEEHGLLDL